MPSRLTLHRTTPKNSCTDKRKNMNNETYIRDTMQRLLREPLTIGNAVNQKALSYITVIAHALGIEINSQKLAVALREINSVRP